MQAGVFKAIQEIVYDSSGILLKEGKQSMVSSRITRRLRALDIADERAYLEYLRSEPETELVHLLDVISTNVTHFFREPEHFEQAGAWLSQLLAGGQRRLRLWSAASSTGEEPYSLAMTLAEAVRRSWRGAGQPDVRILATDISTTVLATAEAGRYPVDKLGGIPDELRKRYLRREGDACRVDQAVRALLLFKRLNLSTPPYPMRGPLDLVMCRNVMIYFDAELRQRIVEDCHRLLRPGGYLFVGKSESLSGTTAGFERAGPSVYRKAA